MKRFDPKQTTSIDFLHSLARKSNNSYLKNHHDNPYSSSSMSSSTNYESRLAEQLLHSKTHSKLSPSSNLKLQKSLTHNHQLASNNNKISSSLSSYTPPAIPPPKAPLRYLLDNGDMKFNQFDKFNAFIISENFTEASIWLKQKNNNEKAVRQKEVYDNFKSKRSFKNLCSRRLPLTSSQSTPSFIIQQQLI